MNWILIVGIMLVILGIAFIPLSIRMTKILKGLNNLTYTDEERDEISMSIEARILSLNECYKAEIERLNAGAKAPQPA